MGLSVFAAGRSRGGDSAGSGYRGGIKPFTSQFDGGVQERRSWLDGQDDTQFQGGHDVRRWLVVALMGGFLVL